MPSDPPKIWFIMYDIQSKKERHKISLILADFGFRLQKSVFECLLSQQQSKALLEKIGKLAGQNDSIIAFPLGAAGLKQMQWIGCKPWNYGDEVFYL